jgi:hypothetical protein
MGPDHDIDSSKIVACREHGGGSSFRGYAGEQCKFLLLSSFQVAPETPEDDAVLQSDTERLVSLEQKMRCIQQESGNISVETALAQVRALAGRMSSSNAQLIAALEVLAEADTASIHGHPEKGHFNHTSGFSKLAEHMSDGLLRSRGFPGQKPSRVCSANSENTRVWFYVYHIPQNDTKNRILMP